MVDDDGPGIPSDKLDDIFERFYSDRPQIGQHTGQELGPRPQHLARYHRMPTAGASRPAIASPPEPGRPALDEHPTLKRAARGRRGRHALHGAAAGGGCEGVPKEVSSLHDAAEVVHGTCVGLGRRAALLRGPLGLRQIGPGPAVSVPRPARPGRPRAAGAGRGRPGLARARGRPPAGLRAREHARQARGTRRRHRCREDRYAEAELVLVVDLVEPVAVERCPNADAKVACSGSTCPCSGSPRSEPSAPIKLALALAHAGRRLTTKIAQCRRLSPCLVLAA